MIRNKAGYIPVPENSLHTYILVYRYSPLTSVNLC